MQIVKPATGDFNQYIIDIERDLSKTVSPAIEDIRHIHGDRIANEILLSACALLGARAVGMVHVWSGEKVTNISHRFTECMVANIRPTIKKIIAHISNQESKNA